MGGVCWFDRKCREEGLLQAQLAAKGSAEVKANPETVDPLREVLCDSRDIDVL